MDDQDAVDIGDDINERELRERAAQHEERIERESFLRTSEAIADEHARQRAIAKHTGEPIEPDERAMVGALLAQLGYVTADIAEPEKVALLADQDREGLTLDLYSLDQWLLQLNTIRDVLAQALAELMESASGKPELIAGFAVTRSKADRVEWDKDSAWSAVRASILERWAMPEGNIEPSIATLVDRVLTDVAAVYTTRTPTVTGLKALSVNPYELRATTPATRWNVKVGA